MTKQSKTTIEAGDILGVEIFCHDCKVTISRPISGLQNNLAACPNCGATWMPYRQTLIYLSDTATRLLHLAALSEQNPKPSISVRFEVTPDKEAKA